MQQNNESMNSLLDKTQGKMKIYRQILLEAGMKEPTQSDLADEYWLFYKQVTDLTAFIVNIRGNETNVEITYGYASTVFTRMSGSEDALTEFGISNEEINLRERLFVSNDEEEVAANARIKQMYRRYLTIDKNELLDLVKLKRKEFIQQIADKLKPLGFKKKANTWTRALENEYYVMFNVQKSDFSDEYYFNVYIGKNDTDHYGDCFYDRVAPDDMCAMDWQVLSKQEFNCFMDNSVVPVLEQVVQTPLRELGKLSFVWSGCYCDRQKCEVCWVDKNMWETDMKE